MRKELIIGRGKEAQQSQVFTDAAVSRRHLSLSYSHDENEKPYYIKLLNYANVVYVNGQNFGAGGYIDINDHVQLGGNKVELDLKRAIEDLNHLEDISELSTQLPNSDNEENSHTSQDTFNAIPQAPANELGIDVELWFMVSNGVIVVLLILAISFKSYSTIHTILLFLLVVAILLDIILYTNKNK